MKQTDYNLILSALLSCKTEINYTEHRFYETKHQYYDEEKINKAIKTLKKVKIEEDVN